MAFHVNLGQDMPLLSKDSACEKKIGKKKLEIGSVAKVFG
jgi:hypothetical protein